MDWVKQLNIAIRYIEEHLTGTIEYDELAKMLCCSTYQFQRMFAFINDVPLSEYIRRRKLSLAVADIQNGERVIDVALKYGYSSPTAFSRAFQGLHGITPSEARKKGTLLKTYPPISFKLTITGTEELLIGLRNDLLLKWRVSPCYWINPWKRIFALFHNFGITLCRMVLLHDLIP